MDELVNSFSLLNANIIRLKEVTTNFMEQYKNLPYVAEFNDMYLSFFYKSIMVDNSYFTLSNRYYNLFNINTDNVDIANIMILRSNTIDLNNYVVQLIHDINLAIKAIILWSEQFNINENKKPKPPSKKPPDNMNKRQSNRLSKMRGHKKKKKLKSLKKKKKQKKQRYKKRHKSKKKSSL